jgi:hypothetical protein
VESETSVAQQEPSVKTSAPLKPLLAVEVSTDSSCTDNWKAANTIAENTTNMVEQTGIFVRACRHGIIQTLVEMR